MASRFWVGGTGTWDASDTTHWSATSGGAGGASVPGTADTVTFNGSSGGGTVTVNTTVTVQSITGGAFTGTLDFSVNNNNVTLSAVAGFNFSGTGTRTLKLGNGTWTISSAGGNWTLTTTTNLTFSANSSTISFTGSGAPNNRTFDGGSLTYNALTLGSNTSGGPLTIAGTNTFASISLTAPCALYLPGGTTQTISNAFTWTGSSANQIFISSDTIATQAAISIASGSPSTTWTGIRSIQFTGGATFTATNSFDLGSNNGITITGPSAGGIMYRNDMAGNLG